MKIDFDRYCNFLQGKAHLFSTFNMIIIARSLLEKRTGKDSSMKIKALGGRGKKKWKIV